MEWNIQSRAHACQACHRAFAHQEIFHTLLFDQKAGYERLDVCGDCWRSQYSQGALDRKGFVSYWQSNYLVPPASPPDPIQKETAETLVRKLIESGEERYRPAIYVLGAMLERKRVLKVKTQLARAGRRIFVYEHGKSGDLFQIEDPNLQLDQLEGVQHEVLRLLEHGLSQGEPPADSAVPAGAAAASPPSLDAAIEELAASRALSAA